MSDRIEVASVGYQGATVHSFLQALREAGIELLVDVRAVAGEISRTCPACAPSTAPSPRTVRPVAMRIQPASSLRSREASAGAPEEGTLTGASPRTP